MQVFIPVFLGPVYKLPQHGFECPIEMLNKPVSLGMISSDTELDFNLTNPGAESQQLSQDDLQDYDMPSQSDEESSDGESGGDDDNPDTISDSNSRLLVLLGEHAAEGVEVVVEEGMEWAEGVEVVARDEQMHCKLGSPSMLS